MKDPVLITGTSSGIGFGMAQRFLAEGHEVIGSVRTEQRASELRELLGGGFFPLVFDVCEAVQVAQAAVRAAEHLKGRRLAALINNAGSAEIGPLLHTPLDDLRRQLEVLAVGQLAVTQQFHQYLLPIGKGARPGRIINISSTSGMNASRFFGCYAAGKHALEGLSKALRIELQSSCIPVVVVAPGNIATPIWSKQTQAMVECYRDTPEYPQLVGTVRHLSRKVPGDAMTVAEFTERLYAIFKDPSPARRYTVIKCRRRGLPLSRLRVRVFRK